MAAAAIAAAGAPQPGTPAYLQQAYDLSYLSETAGTDETIAIVDAFDDPNAESDLGTYRAEFGLPACTSANGCFTKVDQNGGTNYPATVDTGWELEISLDLDAVSALCPNCHIDLVEANSAGTADLAAAQNSRRPRPPGVNVISDSWDAAAERPPGAPVSADGPLHLPGRSRPSPPRVTSATPAQPRTTSRRRSRTSPRPAARRSSRRAPAACRASRGFTESAWSGAGSGCNLGASKPRMADRHRLHGPLVCRHLGRRRPRHRDAGLRLRRRRLGRRRRDQRGLAADRGLLRGARVGRARARRGRTRTRRCSTIPRAAPTAPCAASISYICNAGPGYDGPTGVGSISGAVATGAPGYRRPRYQRLLRAERDRRHRPARRAGSTRTARTPRYWWEYGTTTDYGQQTRRDRHRLGHRPGRGIGLAHRASRPATTYHYRLVAQNQLRHRVRLRLHAHHPGLVRELAHPGLDHDPDHHDQSPPATTTTTSNPPVTGTGGSGSSGTSTRAGRRPAGDQRQGRAGGEHRDDQRHDRGPRSSHHLRAPVRDDGALGRTALGLAGPSRATANVSWTLREPVPGQDLLPPRRGDQRRRDRPRHA